MKSSLLCKIAYAKNSYYNNRKWVLYNLFKYFKSYSMIVNDKVFLLADRKQVIQFKTYDKFSSFEKIISFEDFVRLSLKLNQ